MADAAALIIEIPAWVETAARSSPPLCRDTDKMTLLLRLAEENVARRAGGPFAAAVLEIGSGRIVAAGVNSVERQRNCVLHAEILALMLAQQRVGSFTLRAPDRPAHELVTSCEPCAMCLGATLWSGVTRLVIGAERSDAMAVGFDEGPVFAESYAYLAERGVETVRGVQRAAAAALLRAYREGGGLIYNADAPPTTT